MKKKLYTIIAMLLLCGWAQAQTDSLQNNEDTPCEAPQFTVYTIGTDAIFNWLDSDFDTVFVTDTLFVADTVIVSDTETVIVSDTLYVNDTVIVAIMRSDTFLIIYNLSSGMPEDNVYEMVVGEQHVISGLLPQTEYIARMAMICNGDTSALSEGTIFTTGCGTYIAPYEEHFGSSQHCWTLDPSFSLGVNQIYTTNYVVSSSGMDDSFVDTSRAVSPVIDVSGLSHPYLKFSRIQNEYDGERKDLALYYREYEEDEWHDLGTFISPTSSYEWKTDSLAIPSYSTTLQLGFFSIAHENQPLATISLKDIYIYDGTDCPPIADLALSGISTDTAFIHWIYNDSASCPMRYKTPSDTDWIYTNGLSGQAYVTPITPLTIYEVQVSPACDTMQWASCTFSSGCIPYVAPFEEHFSSIQHCWILDPAFSYTTDCIYTTNYSPYAPDTSNGYFDTVRAVSPVIDVSGLSHPYLKFSRIQNDANGVHKDLALYYREYEGDEWHDLGTFISTTSSTDWKTDSLAIPSQSATLQLGFFSIAHENQQFPRISLDDIYVYDGTDCPPVTDLTLSEINADTAFIHWINCDTVDYQVRYRILPDTNWFYTNDTNGTALITPIEILSEYEVQVSPSCDLEQWVSCSFTTGCGAFVAPFEEHFATSQHCWTLDSSFTTGVGNIYTSNYVSPTISTNYGYIDTARAISPIIDVSALANPYLKFSRIQNEHNGTNIDLALYYRDYEEDEWHYLGTYITPTVSSNWKTDSLAIPSHSATLQLGFFSILHENSQQTAIHLDDIYVYDGPECPPASDLALSGFNADTAFIHWIADTNTPYVVRYRVFPETNWQYANDLNGMSFIEPLAPLTNYEVQVSPLCDAETWSSFIFTSPSDAVNLPYFTDFSETADRGWQFDNGTCLNHWKIGDPGDYPQIPNALFVTFNDTVAGYGQDNFYTTITAFKKFNLSDISTVNIEFDVLCGGDIQNYTPKDYLKVFFAPSSEEYPSSENNVAYAEATASTYAVNFQDYLSQTGDTNYRYKLNLTQDSVLHISVEMPNPTPNGESKLVFVWHNDHSYYSDVQPAAIITNVHVWQNDCDVVSLLNVYDIAGQTALVSWEAPAYAPTIELQYKPHAMDWADPGVSTILLDSNYLILHNLLSDTAYDVRVRVDCGDTLGVGNWRYVSFNTHCGIVVTDSTPYMEDFNYIGLAPECWNLTVNPLHSWFKAWYAQSLVHDSHGNNDWGEECPALPPTMDISAVSNPYLKFKHEQGGVRVTFRTSALSPWQELATFYENAVDSVPLPSSNIIQIAFYPVNNGNVSLDDVTVYNGPSCVPMVSVTVVDVTANAAAISWVGNHENGYLIRYRDISDTTWTYFTTPDTSYIINGLQDSHTYIVEVSGDCNEPNWMAVQLSTPLSVATLPYFTDFAPTSDHGWLLNNGNCANYWTMGTYNATDNVYALFITNNGSTPGYSITNTSVVTAEKLFEVAGVDSITVEFDVRIGGEKFYDFIKLYVAPEFVEYPATSTADSYNPDYASRDYTFYAFNFSPYYSLMYEQNYLSPYIFNRTAGDGLVHISAVMPNPIANNLVYTRAKVVFLWKNDYSEGGQPGAIITNVSVRDNSCAPVSALTVSNVLSTTADITWTPNSGGETDWVVEYKESLALTWNQILVSGTPSLSLTGLNPSTDYDIRVKTDCGNSQSIPQSATFTTTPCDYFCPYTFILYDNSGDGWNGNAAVHVMQQGLDIASLVATNHYLQNTPTYDTVLVDLCHGEDITLQWTWGIWWMEDGVTVLDPDGNQVYSIIGMTNHDSTLTTFTTSCPFVSPTVVTGSASNITQTGAVLHGHIEDYGDLPILDRGFEWKPLFSSNFTTVTAIGDTLLHPLSGLSPNTDYVYRAFATTLSGTTYGDDLTFTTLEEELPPCSVPTDLHVADSSSSTLAIAWIENGDAEQWNILYRAGNGALSSDVSYTTSYLITDLQPNTEYQIQVQSVCGVQTSEWTPVVTASTTTGLRDYDWFVIVYPNPANNVVCVNYLVNIKEFSGGIQVYDVYGKTVVETFHETSLQETRIDISGLSAGMYFVRVTTEEGAITKAFVKQ